MTLARADRCIETPRLMLRRMVREDLEFYGRLHADPDVARYVGPGRPRTQEESRALLEATLRCYEELGVGQLALVRKSDGALIGRCGLSCFEIEVPTDAGAQPPRAYHGPGGAPAGTPVVVERELGYTLERAAWGHGYATEAAAAVYRYVRERLGLVRLISIIHPDNAASLGVARKLGLRLEDFVLINEAPYGRHVWPGGDSAGPERELQKKRSAASGGS